VPPEEFGKALEWAKDPASNPDFVRNVILALEGAQEAGQADAHAARRAVEALARAMGIIPSSEKVSPRKSAPAEPIDAKLAVLVREEKKLQALERYVGRKLRKARKDIVAVMQRDMAGTFDAASCGAEKKPSRELVLAGSAASGHGHVPSGTTAPEDEANAMGKKAIRTGTTHEKNDLVLDNRTRIITGEKIYDPVTGRTLGPDLGLVGPKGRKITWRALANVVVLVFGMALPASRIEKLFGKKGFSRSGVSDHCAFIAGRLLPVYVAMAKEIAQCDIIMGDDCVSRVSDITRYRRDKKEWRKARKAAADDAAFLATHPEPTQPWHNLPESSLTTQLQSELDFEFQHNKVDKEKTPKIKLNTSLLSAELETGNPKSRVVIYRSHLGSVGNLLSRLLLSRKRKKDDSLIFVGDLSASNHVTDPDVLRRVKVQYAGCASHARRPFKRHMNADPVICIDGLDFFRGLFHIEELLAEGREHHKEEVRRETSMSFWNDLKELSEETLTKWSPSTALGEAANYILGNYDALTLYCRDIRLPVSNDLSERLLRYEKLMDRSSFGRETVEGRARYDIIRSFWQSCVAAGVDPTYALLDVLLTDPSRVAALPGQYTPQSIAKRLEKDPDRCLLLDKVLHATDLGTLVSYKLHDPNVPFDDDPA
jgi:hypothetical protein